jgi:hypothetical protein
MGYGGYFSKEERTARSQAAKLVHRSAFVYGSIVTSERKCGKENCRCHQKGESGHVSSYLSVRIGKQRKMIFIPKKMLGKARGWVKAYKELSQYILKISEKCLDRLNEG